MTASMRNGFVRDDVSGALLVTGISGGAVDTSTLVVLAPATSTRNTVQPTVDAIPMVLKGAAAQTQPLLQFQNSAGSPLLNVAADGTIPSPTFTGTPTVPTAAQGTNTTQAASTAFVQTASGLLIPKSLGTTKGDTIAFTGSGVPVRKAAGADGKFFRADSSQSDGLLWADAPAGAPRIASGRYSALSPARIISTNALTQDVLYGSPFVVATAASLVEIGLEITTLGAGVSVRLGVFADVGGIPTTTLFDAGTFSAATTGVKVIAITQTLQPGLYWYGVVSQGGTCTVRSGRWDLVSHATAATTSGFEVNVLLGPNTSGAFGGTFGAVSATNAGIDSPRVLVKGA